MLLQELCANSTQTGIAVGDDVVGATAKDSKAARRIIVCHGGDRVVLYMGTNTTLYAPNHSMSQRQLLDHTTHSTLTILWIQSFILFCNGTYLWCIIIILSTSADLLVQMIILPSLLVAMQQRHTPGRLGFLTITSVVPGWTRLRHLSFSRAWCYS